MINYILKLTLSICVIPHVMMSISISNNSFWKLDRDVTNLWFRPDVTNWYMNLASLFNLIYPFSILTLSNYSIFNDQTKTEKERNIGIISQFLLLFFSNWNCSFSAELIRSVIAEVESGFWKWNEKIHIFIDGCQLMWMYALANLTSHSAKVREKSLRSSFSETHRLGRVYSY